MARAPGSRIGDLSAMVQMTRTLHGVSAAEKRQMIAQYCKMLGSRVGSVVSAACDSQGLSPRMRQTLGRLLAGDSEKEVAVKLRISRHTVHIYVKRLYKHFGVSSRGELLAKCLSGSRLPVLPLPKMDLRVFSRR